VRLERRLEPPWWLAVVIPVASIVAALLAGAIVLVVTGHDPIDTYQRLLDRGFLTEGSISSALVTATPLLFTGLAAAVAFRMRLWNIGAEGQLYMGAVGASAVGIALGSAPPALIIPAMVAGGLTLGAAWGAIPGILKAYANTNEIITSLMLNYVAGLVLAYLIFDSRSYWRDLSPAASTFPQGKRLDEDAHWPSWLTTFNPALLCLLAVAVIGAALVARAWLREGSTERRLKPLVLLTVPAVVFVVWALGGPSLTVVIPLGFVLGVGLAIVLQLVNSGTRFGFEVLAIGDSPAAARYAGMRTRRKVVAVMMLSGGIAGIGGASQVGDFAHTLDPRGLQQSGFGYMGIVVAALARTNPLGAVVISVLLGGLANAGYSLQGPDFPAGLVGMLQGLILFFAIGGEVLARYRVRLGRALPTRTSTARTPAQLAPALKMAEPE
jgi:general nucleoside transport system permease protein